MYEDFEDYLSIPPSETEHLRPQARTRPTGQNGRLRYFAYGSNLCVRSMSTRCPKARPVGEAILWDWRMTFRGVADVEKAEGEHALGAVWEITRECEAALDRYEGVAGGFYRKEYLTVDTPDGPVVALVYVMNYTYVDNCSLPSQSYFGTIVRGYGDFGLSFDALEASLEQTRHRVVEVKGITEFTEHGPKRMGPAGTRRRTRRAAGQLPKRERKAERKALVNEGIVTYPSAVTTRSGIPLVRSDQRSPATRALDAAEAREKRSQRARNEAALAILTGPEDA